ncbi:S49 family peptidase (plasmid) [Azospirillum sp. HJ39]|uniref:S49 family peptidase n=1 Tax=Azospirillum sp. HJ39 TaxID=3159496 RepID=UPI0035569BE4
MSDLTDDGAMAAELRYAHVIRAVSETPWAIMPGMLAVITDLLAFRAAGGRLSKEDIRQRIAEAQAGKPAADSARVGSARSGAIAVLPLFGVITPRAGMFADVSGMAALDRFRARFREALADEQVGTILIRADTPGGSVDLVQEAADEIFNARGKKRVVGIADTMAASAGYWLLSQCEELVVTPSGEVGSIGVFSAHTEYTQAMEKAGVKTTLIRAGKFKAESNPYEPLTEEARGAMQARVNDYYDSFVKAVARGRGVKSADVRGGFGEGRVVGSSEAKSLGMVDGVATFEDTLSRLAGRSGGSGSRNAVADDRILSFV